MHSQTLAFENAQDDLSELGLGFGCGFLDVDLDGYEDLLCATGHMFDTQDLERRVMMEPEAEPPPLPDYDRNAPGRVQTIQITALPEIGSTFAGRYLVEALIGEGGSAVVFRVVDTEISEPVALKIFRWK